MNYDLELRKKVFRELPNLFPDCSDNVLDRIEKELSTIEELQISDVIIMLQDIVKEAESQGVLFGYGYSGMCGSIVNYILGITKINPLEYGLVFERFAYLGMKEYPNLGFQMSQCNIDEVLVKLGIEYKTSDQDPNKIRKYYLFRYDNSKFEIVFFCLKTFDIIKETINTIKEKHGIEVDIYNLDLQDSKTFELYGKGQTKGTFQFESEEMRMYLRDLKPENMLHLSAINALYRPNALYNIPEYIDRKNNRLGNPESYGLLIYQERVTEFLSDLLDISLDESEIARWHISKLKISNEDKKTYLLELAKTPEIREKVNNVVDSLLKDNETSFNFAHSLANTYIAYITVYLKANFFAEYMSCVVNLNSRIGEDRLSFLNFMFTESRIEGLTLNFVSSADSICSVVDSKTLAVNLSTWNLSNEVKDQLIANQKAIRDKSDNILSLLQYEYDNLGFYASTCEPLELVQEPTESDTYNCIVCQINSRENLSIMVFCGSSKDDIITVHLRYEAYKKYKDLIKQGSIVQVKGKFKTETFGEEKKEIDVLFAEEVKLLMSI